MPAIPSAPVRHKLRITSEPSGAEVLVDGLPEGQTPLELSFEQGQRVDLTLQGPGLEPKQYTHVMAGAANLPLTLQRKKATLTLTSKPPGATVLRDGRSLGETPLPFTDDAEVPVKLVLTLKGHARREVTVTPRDGEVQEFELVRQSAREDLPFKTKGQR
jgi:hypothetical protein